MADSVSRILRDGSLEGEHALALSIKDTAASPFGLHVFTYMLSQLSSSILAGKSQSRGVVLVSFSRSPSFYLNDLRKNGLDVSSSHKWIQVLDCYTDPLGWKEKVMDVSSHMGCVCNNLKDLEKLCSLIIDMGKGLVGQGKVRFSVAIDSVSEMLRHAPMTTIAQLLSNLRSHEQVSSIFWLLHSDLHEAKVISSLEYMSSMVASVEPLIQSANGQKGDTEKISLLEQNLSAGKFQVRCKRRNGRVRTMCEEFHIEESGINFKPVSSEDGIFSQGPLPKVQFNLQLSEKEQAERAKVILPFEHQGEGGKPIQIYDGRRSLADNEKDAAFHSTDDKSQRGDGDSHGGEIIYYRDSDDERPDSDEDPDDDLDI